MTAAAWIVVAVLFAGTVVLKAVGPVTFGGRRLSLRAAGVIGLVAPALLAEEARGRRAVAAAAVAIAVRRSMIVVVVVAALTAAATRALFS